MALDIAYDINLFFIDIFIPMMLFVVVQRHPSPIKSSMFYVLIRCSTEAPTVWRPVDLALFTDAR